MNTHGKIAHHAISHNFVFTVTMSCLVLSLVTLTIPVFHGCEKYTHPQDSDFTEMQKKSSVKLAVLMAEDSQIRSIDAFVFNDDALGRIDCYQRSNEFNGEELLIGSCSGNKIAILCANAPWTKMEWKDVYSLGKTTSIKVNLEDEDKEYPVMSTITRLNAGEDTNVCLERLSSEVELRSISCDFSGKPYEGESITDAKVYLINVNATCSMVPEGNYTIERIINHGSLIPEDVINLMNVNTITDTLETINPSHTYPGVRLLCYPNLASEETLGTPFTRLVIEGKIQGETWYWPINVNRDCGTDHEGIERNMRYIYDITIKSKGTKDPNTPIIPEMAETIFKTERWEEKEPYYVAF